MNNEQRAEAITKKYGFDFNTIPKHEITELIEAEIDSFQPGSSEYIRVLCGYLYCIGAKEDAALIRQAKYEINFDVGCMIDLEWIESLEEHTDARPKQEIIDDFVSYYQNFEADDWDW